MTKVLEGCDGHVLCGIRRELPHVGPVLPVSWQRQVQLLILCWVYQFVFIWWQRSPCNHLKLGIPG